jgi:hypothetical protein
MPKINKEKNQRNFKKEKFNSHVFALCSSVDVGKLSDSPALLSIVFKSLCDLLSISLPFIL